MYFWWWWHRLWTVQLLQSILVLSEQLIALSVVANRFKINTFKCLWDQVTHIFHTMRWIRRLSEPLITNLVQEGKFFSRFNFDISKRNEVSMIKSTNKQHTLWEVDSLCWHTSVYRLLFLTQYFLRFSVANNLKAKWHWLVVTKQSAFNLNLMRYLRIEWLIWDKLVSAS